MALTDKLTAIADAIRAKTGKTETMTLDAMPTEIENIVSETFLKPTEYPDYVRTEINRVADEVRKVITNDSFVSICLSDSHYPADNNTKASGIHAMMAIKGLTYLLPVDFIAHLGDVGFEGVTSVETTTDLLETNLTEMLSYIKESNGDSIPLFVAIGNHDSGNYITSSDNSDMLSGEYLYNNFTALSASDDTVFAGEENGGYCYRDFADKKIRVFLLNTSEEIITGGYSNDRGASETQREWVALKLQELNAKTDAADWGFIVLCHYPADYGGARSLSNLFAAYVNGTSITLNGTAYNFNGINSAKFIVQHHGHIHNFLADKLYAGDTPVQYDAWRVGIPNTQHNRENYYGEFAGVQYGEPTNYTKTPNTVEDTSFVVNVINPSEEKIYSFHYGAGYDRVIGYGATTYYSIQRTLANVVTNNTLTSIEEGKSYSEILMLNSGCDMQTMSVTMGGLDVTSSAVTIVDGNYQIAIDEVTGNIVITAKAQARPNFTNLVPLSINTDGTDYNVDGDGYDNDTYIGSDGTLKALSGFVSTGFIPVTPGAKTIRIAGDGITANNDYTRFAFYKSDFSLVVAPIPYWRIGSTAYYGALIDEDATAVTFDMTTSTNGYEGVYMRVCTAGDGANLIVTVDEEITYGGTDDGGATLTYAVVQNLTNVASSNSASHVTSGDSFSTTLTANEGYELESVVVTMGGLDVTNSVYADGNINISSVTGNIVITASADVIKASGYTNMIPLAVEVDGTTPYNSGKGYKTGTRLSTSSQAEKTLTGMCVTGYIPVSHLNTIRIKNVTLENTSDGSTGNTYLYDYNTLQEQATGGSIPYSTLSSEMTDGVITHQIRNAKIKYVRLCCGNIDDTSIITVNEEIV